MISGRPPDFAKVLDLQLGNAMVAGAGFDTYIFRQKFDISIPVYSPVAKLATVNNIHYIR